MNKTTHCKYHLRTACIFPLQTSKRDDDCSGSPKSYFVRVAQPLRQVKFPLPRLRRAYCHIKVLKKVLGLAELSNFMVKKVLMQGWTDG